MSLTTEQRYKPYAEWTEEEIKKIKENVATFFAGMGAGLGTGLQA